MLVLKNGMVGRRGEGGESEREREREGDGERGGGEGVSFLASHQSPYGMPSCLYGSVIIIIFI